MKTYTTNYIRKFLEDFLGFCEDHRYYMYTAHGTLDRYNTYADTFYIRKLPVDLYTTRARVLSRLVLIGGMPDRNFNYICKIGTGDFKDIEPEYVISCANHLPSTWYIKDRIFRPYLLPIHYIMTLYKCALFRQDSETIDKLFGWYRDYILDYLNTGVFEKEVDKMVEFYTAEEENGELVAWLLEFKKNRFGFQGSDGLSL